MHEVLQASPTHISLSVLSIIPDQEPANAQQSFSTTRYPSAYRTIPVLEFLQETWENMAHALKFAEVSDAIGRGLANLKKWYRKVDETNAYFICLGTSLHRDAECTTLRTNLL